MNNRRLLLLAIAIVAVGVFALPSTVSLFSGQHRWYNLSTGTNDVPCEKCHADVAEEMNTLAGPHTGETGYGRLKCGYCHRTFKIEEGDTNPSDSEAPNGGYDQYPDVNLSLEAQYLYTYASGDGSGATPGKQSHAASTIPCMYCHSGGSQGIAGNHDPFSSKSCVCHGTDDGGDSYYYHGDRFYTGSSDSDPGECIKCHGTGPVRDVPPAGGFNLTANATDTGERAAHKTFVMNSISNIDMEDANEACIACHTSIPVKIRWTHGRSLEFNATYDKGLVLPPTHFNTSGYKANGTVEVTSYGNYSGGANTTKFPEPVTVWG